MYRCKVSCGRGMGELCVGEGHEQPYCDKLQLVCKLLVCYMCNMHVYGSRDPVEAIINLVETIKLKKG